MNTFSHRVGPHWTNGRRRRRGSAATRPELQRGRGRTPTRRTRVFAATGAIGGLGALGLLACASGANSDDASAGIETVQPGDDAGDTGSTGLDPTSAGAPTSAGDSTSAGGCPAPQACGAGCCASDEVCVEGACVLDCGPDLACGSACCDTGAGEICYVGQCVVPSGSCSDATCATSVGSDCGDGEVCAPELGQCVPDLGDPACAFTPEVGVFAPVPRFTWGRRADRACEDGCEVAEVCNPDTNRCEPTWNHVDPAMDDARDFSQVVMTPMVADLDQDCIPEIIFTSYAGSEFQRNGVLRAIHGDDGSPYFTVATYNIDASAAPAIGDIDLDGMPEIIAVTPSRLLAFEHDGTLKWAAADHTMNGASGAPSIANFDNAGAPEIAYGNTIWDANGFLLFAGSGAQGANGMGPLSCVADLNGDTRPELIAGAKTWTFTGQVGVDFAGTEFWTGEVSHGFCGVADFDLDGAPEVVSVFQGTIRVFDGQNGNLLGSVDIPTTRDGYNGGGPPSIADFDGDGTPDIGTAGATAYVVAQFDGSNPMSVLWQARTRDASSQRTGSSVFDFDGDGRSEVVYGDEQYLRIYPGTEPGCPDAPTCDGIMTDDEVLFIDDNSSRTRAEYPVIADVDGDFKAEIIISTNSYGAAQDNGNAGIKVLEDRLDNWVPTRPIWNQHTYHVTNIANDGTVPEFEEANWSVPVDQPYNSYRRNSQGSRSAQCAPDLTPDDLEVDFQTCSRENLTIRVKVTNRGCLGVGPGVNVAFFEGDTLLTVAGTAAAVPPGGSTLVEVSVPRPGPGPYDISAVVDEDETGEGSLNECGEDNNRSEPRTVCQIVR